MEQSIQKDHPVRCLDCGTEYDLVGEHGEAVPCPACGGVGWVSLPALRKPDAEEDQS